MNEIQTVSAELPEIKICNGERVVTFKDIDTVHQRTDGTAGRSFRANKKHFIEGIDYFRRNPSEAKGEYSIVAPNGLIVLTESGYLMITKTFTDDLSWDVQRQLVNNYFQKKPEPQPALPDDEEIFDSWALIEKPVSETWFAKNNWKLKIILNRFGWSRKYLYHKILVELSDIHNLSLIEKSYLLSYGRKPEYALDLLDYSDELARTATRYINYLLIEED